MRIQELYHDVSKGNLPTLKDWLKHGEPEIFLHKERLLKIAAKYGHVECLEMLLDSSSVSDCSNYDLIRLSAKYGHLECLKILLMEPMNTKFLAEYYRAILEAARRGKHKCVETLLRDPRFDPCDFDRNPHLLINREGVINKLLEWSSQYGYADILKILIHEKEADPSVNNQYALLASSENGHVECALLLLQDHRVDPSVAKNYVLRMAERYGRDEILGILREDERVVEMELNLSKLNVG